MKMKRLKDFVEIDKRFQNSINLQLDLQDDTKLESYIPTKSSLLILQKYLKSVMGQEQEKATILIGPYGKGKSHLLLVLLQIQQNWWNSTGVRRKNSFRLLYPVRI